MGQRRNRVTTRAARVVVWATTAAVGLGPVIGTTAPSSAEAHVDGTTTAMATVAAPLDPTPVSLPAAHVPALLADGLAEETTSRYVYDATSGTVRADMTTTIRNVKPDQGLAYFYWTSYAVPVPHNVKDLRAVSDGTELPVQLQPSEDEHTKWATASFPQLRFGGSRTIEWSFTIPGDPIRSEGYTRMGKGYATFEVYASGDPGSTHVEVVAPQGMEFVSSNGEFTEARQGESVTWSAGLPTEDYGIWALVSLRDPEAADSTTVTVGGEELTLLSFPGDEKWTRFVRSRLEEGLPVVEKMIGRQWPGGLRTIREDVSTEVVGYAWFDSRNEEIIIGEELDEQLFFHELTHTWINGDTLEGRWLSEGLTEVVARRVVEEMGGEVERPDVGRQDPGSVPLNTWKDMTGSFGDADRETETYAYAAAAATVEKLVADLDDEQFSALVSALLEGASPYARPGDRTVTGDADWRRLLDLLEDQAGVSDAQRVLATRVLTDKQKKRLPRREAARETYFALDEADGTWNPPEGLRTGMASWDFAEVDTQHEKLGDVPQFARRVQAAAAAGGFDDPTAAREAYEKAVTGKDYDELGELMPRAAETTERVSAVVRQVDADDGPLTELGEWLLATGHVTDGAVEDLDAGDYETAASGAERATRLASLAPWAGAGAIGLVAGLALLVFGLIRTVRRRRRAAGPPDGPITPPSAEQREFFAVG